MKKIIVSAIIYTMLLALSGCPNVFVDTQRQKIPPEGYGAVRVMLNQGAARTAIPMLVMDNFSLLEYMFSKDGGQPEPKVPEDDDIFLLEPGEYNLTVKAYVEDADENDILVAEGHSETTFTVEAGKITRNISITLHPFITGTGHGSFEFSLNYPSLVTVETFTLRRIAGEEIFNLLEDAETEKSEIDSVVFSGLLEGIPVGYYIMELFLVNKDGAYTGRTEVVHIYQNLTTEINGEDYTFTAEDFSIYAVFNTNDDGPGSLRKAIQEAPTGQIIKVLLEPGSIIKLKSVLFVNTSINIEGNGVTITPDQDEDDPWQEDDNSQLLYINSSSATVKISRIHFMDGRAANYGAAIQNNYGILTLESCIFSGSRTSTNDANGGAIYNSGFLTVKGCTFYGNSSVNNGYGGAIYTTFGGLSLTGNLFYGNTAAIGRGPAVYRNSGTVNSDGRNVADVTEWVGNRAIGWNYHSTDKVVGTLPISPLTFRLLSGSGAASVIVNLPAEYPIKDFYGSDIRNGAAAGAVQAAADGYYLGLNVNNNERGSACISSGVPNQDGLYIGAVTLEAEEETGYVFSHWLKDGVHAGNTNPWNMEMDAHIFLQAVFSKLITVTNLNDADGGNTDITLRYALQFAEDWDLIQIDVTTPGIDKITLNSALPSIVKSITIEGNGVTLAPDASWAAGNNSQLLYINSTSATVKISRVHFMDGRAVNYGAAIRSNNGTLTLESCIFSGNQTSDSGAAGGAVYNSNGILTLKGCTFYGNNAGIAGGAIFTTGGVLHLTGNLFYGNEAEFGKVVYSNGTVSSHGYNVTDVSGSGWTAHYTDKAATLIPLSPLTFRLLSGGEAENVITDLPEAYPEKDFYGNDINNNAAAGAVQEAASGYYIGLTVNNSHMGSAAITADPPNQDGLYEVGRVKLTATAGTGYIFSHWSKDGVQAGNNNPWKIKLNSHIFIQAMFIRLVTVTSLLDEPGCPANVTLRYALNNAEDGDLIQIDASSGTDVITLTGALPPITKSITIEGNGVTLAPDASWTVNNNSQLLYINSSSATVKISRMHFKDGRAADYGAAICNNNGALTLESCIFSGGQTSDFSACGGAIYNAGTGIVIVNGCTFYNNKTENGYGGAIYNSGSLSLTGNLFYGNEARFGPVVYINGKTVSSYGYNVADVEIGIGNYESGWTGGTGDTTFDNLNIHVLPFCINSFEPVIGLHDVMPSTAITGFPVTDFYGEARNWPGAPGAVK